MIPHTLIALVPWMMAHGYLLYFVAAVIEGSLVTTAAGVVAGLGFFNIYFVILISIAGDLVGDITYYVIGKYSHNILNSKFFKFFGLHSDKLKEMEDILHIHTTKALVLIKLSPLIGPPGLICVGAVKIRFKKFLKTITIISTIKALLFSAIGFYSAKSYLGLSRFLNHSGYAIAGLVLIVVLIQFLYRKAAKKLSKKLEQ